MFKIPFWHFLRHIWKPTGHEHYRFRFDYFGNMIKDLMVEYKCDTCNKSKWKKYTYWC